MKPGRIERSGNEYLIGYDVGGKFQPAHYAKPFKTKRGAERALKERGWL